MIEETARVTQVRGELIDVESVVKSGCSSCQQVDTCGSGQIAKGLGTRRMKLTLTSTLDLNVGDEVVIALPENNLLGAAMQVYILPLLGLLVFGAISQLLLVQKWQWHEIYGLVISLLGGVGGFYLARRLQSQPHRQQALEVKILRKCDKKAHSQAIPINIRN
ncbi:SoxR reducing system RseC family protein [Thalassotalea mangrovi]|uniref:Transcriptional regulator n=1 Tax=Thalassotalea mangrovi TaxID=2572245 RepID=A0A4U1B7I4_9GAMM|nr:SoxR reducing system RseC family protein [Thalassotalea mangrovi]TKB46179.1 transcriptional regulator [Thalassotalea mangrovi]